MRLRSRESGDLLDDDALARHMSTSAFTVETQAVLEQNTHIIFMAQLPDGDTIPGEGIVISAEHSSTLNVAEIVILKMSWRDKRRLSRALNPNSIDWERLAVVSAQAVIVLVVITATKKLLFEHREMWGLISYLGLRLVALMLMGWAFLGLIKKDKL
ncbi:MAG: hypothetical protein AAB036_02375 [Elusimicrobiota bacterium]